MYNLDSGAILPFRFSFRFSNKYRNLYIIGAIIMLKMKDNNYINNIATIRKKNGVSQTQFANAIGVETSTISRIETGKSDPSAVTLFAIAEYLQVSIDDLYTRKTTEQIKNEREQEFFKRNIRYYVSTIESKKNP
jgi:transcriptional regulator with XRE-family HTH domain